MRELIKARADFLAAIRAFFAARAVLEVDTPLLAPYGNPDPQLGNLRSSDGGYLQTSPEFAMKMLLSRGSGDIYQLGHVFRADEHGRRHRREFLLLEWYRCGWDHERLMAEVVELVWELVPRLVDRPVRRLDYDDLFRERFGVAPAELDDEALRALGTAWAGQALDLNRDGQLDLLFSLALQPSLGAGTLDFVQHYPPSQAALARLVQVKGQSRAARFELFVDGLELCNGFWELIDAAEQGERFAAENRRRRAEGLDEVPADPRLLAALARGLPDCAGVALGVERLLMLARGVEDIGAVGYNFPDS